MNALTSKERRTRLTERIAFWSFRLATYLVIAATSYIFLDIGIKGARTVFTLKPPFVNLPFLTQSPETLYVFDYEGKKVTLGDREFRAWQGQHPAASVEPSTVAYSAGGIWPCIVGTALLVIGSMVVALVIGISSAIYLSEYSMNGRAIRLIRVAILNLAGVPSIVFGLFGFGLFAPDVDVVDLRRRIGMVFQKSNPFPKSIYDNVAYGLRIAGVKKAAKINEAVEKSLRSAALWDEVKDRLERSAFGLSGGQQQRLCIARALAVEPEIVLMDEPCSALDPIATAKVEELIRILKQDYTIVIVTHNMQQAGRCSDHTAFFYLGRLIEFGATAKIFSQPSQRQTEDYITGRFG